jgi:XisI protein
MEKLNRHKSIVKALLSDLSEKLSKGIPDVRFEVLLDEEKGQYLLFKDGWRGMHRMYGNVAHIEVKQDGKVWLHHDGTDLALGQILLDKGVEKTDLVLGFQAPAKRADSGFAMA